MSVEIDGGGIAIDEGRVGDWQQTYTGRRFYIEDPRPEDVDIFDIAVSLGNLCRYGGNCPFYSVAEHSILVSYIVPPEYALAGLMHDATEAYMCDVIRPVKRALGLNSKYHQLEQKTWGAIADRFRIPRTIPEEVHAADLAICSVEKEALHPRSQAWRLPKTVPNVQLLRLSPNAATESFISRFCLLTGDSFTDKLITLANYRGQDTLAFQQHTSKRLTK